MIQPQIFSSVKQTTPKAEEVSKILTICNDQGQSVVVHGGLTGLVYGTRTSADQLILSLERMNEIEEIDPIGRTMICQSGVTLQAIQERAEEKDMIFPLDLGARGSCSIGGNISTNAGGASETFINNN